MFTASIWSADPMNYVPLILSMRTAVYANADQLPADWQGDGVPKARWRAAKKMTHAKIPWRQGSTGTFLARNYWLEWMSSSIRR
jgi:hypothetical protein